MKHEFLTTAFDGEGARLYGGRWHSAGRAVVYTSASTSLGLLEQLVHAEQGLPPSYLAIPVTIRMELVETLDRVKLPSKWRVSPPPHGLQQIGNEWAESLRSCVLEVPSVIVPHESNFILNPRHPDFSSLEVGDPISLETDPRLV